MSESTQTKLLSAVPAISSLAEGDKITVVTASGQTALVSLSTLLGAVKVGGRNLIKDSGRQRSSDEYYLGRYEYGDDAPQVGETVLVSLWGTPAPGKVFNAFNSGGDGNAGTTRLTQDKDGVYRGRLEIKKSDAIFAVFASPGSDKTISTIDRVKVERGDIPTDWSPAPEDLNWGGVIPSFSEASKASARISKKGGQLHEHIDNTDKNAESGTNGRIIQWTLTDSYGFAGSCGKDSVLSVRTVEMGGHQHGSKRLQRIGTILLHGATGQRAVQHGRSTDARMVPSFGLRLSGGVRVYVGLFGRDILSHQESTIQLRQLARLVQDRWHQGKHLIPAEPRKEVAA